MALNDWTYQGRPVTEEDVAGQYGFIYLITNTLNDRKYIGRKYFSKAGRKTVKGKTKKIRVESDWQDYYGSSDELKADVERYGKENFTREILRMCKARGEVNYWELKTILESDALLKRSYYNSWCSGKVHATHVKSLWIDDLEVREEESSS